MEIIMKKVDEIKPYEKNPRHNDEAVKYVANSIKEFGFKNPIIIDKNNVIIAGHTRLKASIHLNLESVPCIIADDLTEEQVKALRIADNKVSEISEWNYEVLSEELKNILELDMEDFGFDLELIEEDDEEDEKYEEKTNKYSITYELVFNNEEEKEKWYSFIKKLNNMYEEDTIIERLLRFIEERING